MTSKEQFISEEKIDKLGSSKVNTSAEDPKELKDNLQTGRK